MQITVSRPAQRNTLLSSVRVGCPQIVKAPISIAGGSPDLSMLGTGHPWELDDPPRLPRVPPAIPLVQIGSPDPLTIEAPVTVLSLQFKRTVPSTVDDFPLLIESDVVGVVYPLAYPSPVARSSIDDLQHFGIVQGSDDAWSGSVILQKHKIHG